MCRIKGVPRRTGAMKQTHIQAVRGAVRRAKRIAANGAQDVHEALLVTGIAAQSLSLFMYAQVLLRFTVLGRARACPRFSEACIAIQLATTADFFSMTGPQLQSILSGEARVDEAALFAAMDAGTFEQLRAWASRIQIFFRYEGNLYTVDGSGTPVRAAAAAATALPAAAEALSVLYAEGVVASQPHGLLLAEYAAMACCRRLRSEFQNDMHATDARGRPLTPPHTILRIRVSYDQVAARELRVSVDAVRMLTEGVLGELVWHLLRHEVGNRTAASHANNISAHVVRVLYGVRSNEVYEPAQMNATIMPLVRQAVQMLGSLGTTQRVVAGMYHRMHLWRRANPMSAYAPLRTSWEVSFM